LVGRSAGRLATSWPHSTFPTGSPSCAEPLIGQFLYRFGLCSLDRLHSTAHREHLRHRLLQERVRRNRGTRCHGTPAFVRIKSGEWYYVESDFRLSREK
jgi:hypothetical protein